MRVPLILFVSSLFCVLCCSGCGFLPAGGADPEVADQVLVIVDLSTSLTDDQRRSIPGLVAGFVAGAAQNADVTVYPLVSDIGHSKTLASQIHPPKTGRIVDVADWKKNVGDTWAHELKESVDVVLKLPKKTQEQIYTSCYISSAVFASRYFSGISNAGKLRLLWVGDLIEDCPLPEFRRYRLPNEGAVDRIGGLNLVLKSLSTVEVIGAIIPRDPVIGPSDASYDKTIEYWDALEPHLGMTPSLVKVRPSGAVLPHPLPIQ